MALLVGDIGGTHGRFGLAPENGVRPERVGIEEGDAHATFEAAVAAYLDKTGLKPDRAAFAVAGAVADGRTARITNRRTWEIDAAALERRFGFERVDLMNDFVAQAASLPHLDPASETVPIGGAAPRDRAVKAAIGPGTGLGVAALLPETGGWRPMASEGGHVEFAATSAREQDVFAVIRRAKGRMEAEEVLSGPGLARLHMALADVEGRASESPEPAEIVARAENNEGAARETVTLFLAMLARFSGDVALTFAAVGGVYLCGGVAPRMLGLMDQPAFRAAFEAKEPHRGLMESIATLVVTSPVAGLIGCAAAARRSAT